MRLSRQELNRALDVIHDHRGELWNATSHATFSELDVLTHCAVSFVIDDCVTSDMYYTFTGIIARFSASLPAG